WEKWGGVLRWNPPLPRVAARRGSDCPRYQELHDHVLEPYEDSTRPARMAYLTSSVWPCRPSLVIRLARWCSTVLVLSDRRPAMARVLWPSAASCRTSRSRGVRRSWGSVGPPSASRIRET